MLTLGVYYFVWYYRVNHEISAWGERTPDSQELEVSPAGAVAAVTVGWLLVIPPFVSTWRTFTRIGAAERRVGIDPRASHYIGFLLFCSGIFFLPFEVVYAQVHLTRLWAHEAAKESELELLSPIRAS